MPITVEKIKILFELEERAENIALGSYLYNIGRKATNATPTEDIREMRRDRYAFRSGQ